MTREQDLPRLVRRARGAVIAARLYERLAREGPPCKLSMSPSAHRHYRIARVGHAEECWRRAAALTVRWLLLP